MPLTEKVGRYQATTNKLALSPLIHHGTNSYVHRINAAPTSVMSGLSYVCGAVASVSVISGGNTTMFTAY